MISAGEFRNGVTFEEDGNVLQIVEFQHVKPGKGAAFVKNWRVRPDWIGSRKRGCLRRCNARRCRRFVVIWRRGSWLAANPCWRSRS